MTNETSTTLRKVWAMKRAAQRATRGLSGRDYFRHIRRALPDLGLPPARRHRRESLSRAEGA